MNSSNSISRMMKTASIVLSLTVTAVLGQHGLKLFSECRHNRQCLTQHCVPLCADSSSKAAGKGVSYCIEADWFYTRHGLSNPSCINRRDLTRKMQYTNKRLLGETCHNDVNCMTKHCVPECDSEDPANLWKCIEPKVFYARNKIQPPKCVTKETIKVLNELKVPAASRNLGETCSGHLNCVSGNCVPCCEGSRKESRCIEPRWSFTMYNLPVPVCVDSNTTKTLLKLDDDGGATSLGGFLAGKQAGERTVHSLLNRNNIRVIDGFAREAQQVSTSKNVQAKDKVVQQKVIDVKKKKKEETVQVVPRKGDLRANAAVVQAIKEKENIVKGGVNLRKDTVQSNSGKGDVLKSAAKEVQSIKDHGNTVAEGVAKLKENKEAPKKATDEKRTAAHDASKENVLGDLEAKKLEEEALEKLKQIDIKVMELQDDAMKKRRRKDETYSFGDSGERQNVSLFVLWMHSLHMYFAAAFSLFKFW